MSGKSEAYMTAVEKLSKGETIDMSLLTEDEAVLLWEEGHLGTAAEFISVDGSAEVQARLDKIYRRQKILKNLSLDEESE